MVGERVTGTWRSSSRLLLSIGLVLAFVALLGLGYSVTHRTETSATAAEHVNAAVLLEPTRDPSVPEAKRVLPADDQHQEAIPTF